MDATQGLLREYRSLVFLLLVIGAVSATVIASCGGGGGSSCNGCLCDQCGVTDGPCQDNAFVFPGNEVRDAVPCPTASGNPNGCVELPLICRRKSDSAQQRCYPMSTADPSHPNPDFNFRCDGSRPGGTVLPEPTATPTITLTAPTVTPTATL